MFGLHIFFDTLGGYENNALRNNIGIVQYNVSLTASVWDIVTGAGIYYEGSNITITAITTNSEYEFINLNFDFLGRG